MSRKAIYLSLLAGALLVPLEITLRDTLDIVGETLSRYIPVKPGQPVVKRKLPTYQELEAQMETALMEQENARKSLHKDYEESFIMNKKRGF